MVILGITGGIGTGKSYVAKRLEAMGIPIYNSDSESKRIVNSSNTIREALTTLIGDRELYLPDGTLNRAKLSNYLFSSPENARRVEGIIHPAVREHFRQWVALQNVPICAIESAILIEAGFEDEVHSIVVVDAPMELRIERCMKRDNATRAQIERRIAMQMSQEEKITRADYIIINDNIHDIDLQLSQLIGEKRDK